MTIVMELKVILDLQKVVETEGTQAAAARKLQVHPSDLNRWLRGKRQPSKRILTQLGYQPKIIYQKVTV